MIYTEYDGSQYGTIDGDDSFIVVFFFLVVDDWFQRFSDDSTARMTHIFICKRKREKINQYKCEWFPRMMNKHRF